MVKIQEMKVETTGTIKKTMKTLNGKNSEMHPMRNKDINL